MPNRYVVLITNLKIGIDELVGPVIVSKELIPDPAKLKLKGYKNGKVMQDCGCEYVPEPSTYHTNSDRAIVISSSQFLRLFHFCHKELHYNQVLSS